MCLLLYPNLEHPKKQSFLYIVLLPHTKKAPSLKQVGKGYHANGVHAEFREVTFSPFGLQEPRIYNVGFEIVVQGASFPNIFQHNATLEETRNITN